MSTITTHTTRAEGTILTAAIYNADHVNHVTNAQTLNTDKMEGATPPVVDGHAVLWDGTSAAALKTAGFAPANAARLISAGSGLTGGGNLTADRTLSADFADQATAEAGTSLVKVMSPGRVENWFNHANTKASQAEAEAATEDTKWVSPLKLNNWFDHANQKASQAEAEAATDDTKWMSPLRVAQAVAVLGNLNLGADGATLSTTGQDTGVVGSKGAVFLVRGFATATGNLEISLNGGANYTNLVTISAGVNASWLLVFAKNNRAIFFGLTTENATPEDSTVLFSGNATPTSGSGNIFFRRSSGSAGVVARIM